MIQTDTYRPSLDPRPFVLLLAAAFLLAGIIWSAHAVAKHGSEAEAIRHCLERDGPAKAFRFVNSPKRANQKILCARLDDGRWGLSIVEKTWRGIRERTSFIPDGDGSWTRLWEYISAKGVEEIVNH